jgi:hypothetical protein
VAAQSAGSQHAHVGASSSHLQIVAPNMHSPRPDVHAPPLSGCVAGQTCSGLRQFQPGDTPSAASPASQVQSPVA